MRTRRVLLLLGLCTALTLGLSALLQLAVSPAEADGEDAPEARLLLRCAAADVDDVLRALKGLDVEVYDLDTMKRRRVPVSAKAIPRMADAAALMESMLASLQGVVDQAGNPVVRVESMSIQPRRATVKIEAADRSQLEKARKALGGNLLLQGLGGQEALGAMQALQGGRYRTAISYQFRTGATAGGPELPSITALPHADIARAEKAAGLRPMRASPVHHDDFPDRGYRTVTREFTYDATRLESLIRFVRELTRSQGKPNGLTVHEIRWKLADPKQQTGHPFDRITKPVIAVGFRTPLSD